MRIYDMKTHFRFFALWIDLMWLKQFANITFFVDNCFDVEMEFARNSIV